MPFKPGQSGNPKGRPLGARSRVRQMSEAARAAKIPDLPTSLNGEPAADAVEFFAVVVAQKDIPLSLRLQAAGLLAPFQHARCVSRLIGKPVNLPIASTVEQATRNIAELGMMAAAGQIGLDEANDLVGHLRAFIEARVTSDTEARFDALERALERLTPTVEIEVTEGMPDLPGTSIIMPRRFSAMPRPNGDGDAPPPPKGADSDDDGHGHPR
jgi:hypothetical protein